MRKIFIWTIFLWCPRVVLWLSTYWKKKSLLTLSLVLQLVLSDLLL